MKKFIIFLIVIIIFAFSYLIKNIFLDFSDINISLISKMIDEKKYSEVLDYIDSKIAKNKNDGLLYFLKAKVLFLNEKYDDAIKNLNISINLGYPVVDSYNLKALVYSKKGKYALQKHFATKSIEIDPTDFEAYLIRARAYYYLKDYENSIKDFDTAYQIERDDDILFEKTTVLMDYGKLQSAIEILYELNKLYPDNEQLLYRLYLCYKKIGYYNNAFYLISKLAKKNILYQKEFVRFLYDMGDYYGALNEIYSVINSTSVDKNDVELYKRLKLKTFKN